MERDVVSGEAETRTTPERRASEGPYRSARRIASATIAFLTVHAVFDLAAVVVDVQMLGLLGRVRDGAGVTLEEVTTHVDRMYWSWILQLVAAFAVLVPFVLWLRRVYRNLGPLGIRSLRFKPGWAVGGWFVPFLNLARPKSIVNDVWRASDPELPPEVARPPEGAPVPAAVNGWWAALIAGRLVYPGPVDDVRPTLDAMVLDVQRIIVGDALLVVAAILGIVTVRRITLRQEQRRARLAQKEGVPVP